MPRLTNREIEFYENNLANIRGITESVRRMVYNAGENPDLLADMVRVAEYAAAIRKRTIERRDERLQELINGNGHA